METEEVYSFETSYEGKKYCTLSLGDVPKFVTRTEL